MKTRLILFVAVSLLNCAGATLAARCLRVCLNNKDSILFSLGDTPKYWTSQSKLFVQSASLYQEFDLKDVQKIAFDDVNASVALPNANADAMVYPSVVSDMIYVSSPNDARVEVVSVNGAVVIEAEKRGEDRVEINASAWQTGEYIVRVNDKTFKIIKR